MKPRRDRASLTIQNSPAGSPADAAAGTFPAMSRPTLYLIDGYALIYRAYFALIRNPLRTSSGEETSGSLAMPSPT